MIRVALDILLNMVLTRFSSPRGIRKQKSAAGKANRIPNYHYLAFAHRVSALGHLQRRKDHRSVLAKLLQRKPTFTCSSRVSGCSMRETPLTWTFTLRAFVGAV